MDFLMDEAANKIESLQQELDEAYEKIDKLRLDASYANYDWLIFGVNYAD